MKFQVFLALKATFYNVVLNRKKIPIISCNILDMALRTVRYKNIKNNMKVTPVRKQIVKQSGQSLKRLTILLARTMANAEQK